MRKSFGMKLTADSLPRVTREHTRANQSFCFSSIRTQGSLDVPVSFLNQNDDYGISGVQLLDDDGIPSPTCSRFPRPSHFFWRAIGLQSWAAKRGWSTAMVEWKHDADRDVDYVMGAFFVIRKELFQKLGGFDERFFVYFEETDLAYRVKQAGYKTRFLAGARAYHSAGISSGKVKAHRLFYSVRSRLLYGYKHWGRCATAALLAESLVLEPVARCARAALKLSAKEIREVLDGYRMLWRDLGNWRSTIQRHSEEDREARRSDR